MRMSPYTIQQITEFIIAVDAPGNFICPAETMVFQGVSCERSDDREGIIRLNYHKQSVQFESPVAVLMDSSLRVTDGERQVCIRKINAILEDVREYHKGNPEIVLQVGDVVQAFMQVLEPMVHLTGAPIQLKRDSLLAVERVDDKGQPINRSVRVYLRGLKVETLR